MDPEVLAGRILEVGRVARPLLLDGRASHKKIKLRQASEVLGFQARAALPQLEELGSCGPRKTRRSARNPLLAIQRASRERGQ